MALGLTQPLTEMSTRNIYLRGKGGRCVGLTTLPPSFAEFEIWEPQPPGTLRACPGLYRDCSISIFFSFAGYMLPVTVFLTMVTPEMVIKNIISCGSCNMGAIL
jgi:hypothetical protein